MIQVRALWVALFLSGVGFSGEVTHAAQVGKVIVDEASLREYPQESSKVLAKIKKDESVTVSNQPTSGFYKARLKSGQVGWLSGNEIFVKGTKRGNVASSSRKGPRPDSDIRIQLSGGLSMLGYSGMKDVYDTTALSPLGFSLEGQFRMSEKLFWALRAQYHMASGDSTINATTTQNIKTTLLPVMVGVNYTLMKSDSIRVGAGLYLGLSVTSATTVTWTDATTVQEVKYSSLDPTGDLSIQGVYQFLDSMGFLLDVGYHYQKTGEFGSTTRFGGKSAFAIGYSGLTLRGGIELLL